MDAPSVCHSPTHAGCTASTDLNRWTSGTACELNRLTAGWLALFGVLFVARFWVLILAERATPNHPILLPWLPLAAYQDVAFVVIVATCLTALLRRARGAGVRRLVKVVAWGVVAGGSLYAVLSAEIFRFLKTPLTYRLIAMSDQLRGIRSSLDAAVTAERLAAVLAAPVVACCGAMAILWLSPNLAGATRRVACSWCGRTGLALYLASGFAATAAAGIDSTVLANPHWTLIASLWDRSDPFLASRFRPDDLAEFDPRTSARQAPTDWHGRCAGANVLIVVLESVGSQYLGHFGAPYDNSPELARLAESGITFDNMYASQPFTSNAMAGIFCSVYPWHGWRSLAGRAPGLRVPGLGDVLAEKGYRTGLMHTGDMRFDDEAEFLQRHGFATLHDVWDLSERIAGSQSTGSLGRRRFAPDRLLVPAALDWIDADRSRPFFLTLWTIQTHHPYHVEGPTQTIAGTDADLNRYLNAIRESDAVLGELRRELKQRELLESTLIVVVGDHGEAFGQHGHHMHGQTLHEEELRIPLVVSHPRLARGAARRMAMRGQQIDLSPTLLDLLGVAAPRQWQGESLFATDRTGRVYLFTAFHHYLFGVIDGDRKYLHDVTADRSMVFDLRRDAGELCNLMRSPESRGFAADAHRRLAAWLHFQNGYLGQLIPRN